jgi:hypothetical protein
VRRRESAGRAAPDLGKRCARCPAACRGACLSVCPVICRPAKTEPRPWWPGFRKGGRMSKGARGKQGSKEESKGGGGGWAVPPPLRSLHQRRRSLGWSLSRVPWALCRRSPWRPLVASGGSKPPAGDTVRTGGGRSCTVRVRCGGQPALPYRFGRPGRRLGPAAVAANSLPVPFSARGNRREARSGGGTGRHTSTVSAKGLAEFPCRPERAGPHVGVAFGRLVPFVLLFRPVFPPCCRGRGGPPRPAGRGGQGNQGDQARACTLRRAALSCAEGELAQGVPNVESTFFQYVTIY